MLMKNRKSLFIIIAAITIVAAGITAFATGSFKMKYEPGTEDTVTNMPAEADWTAGTNTVSSNVPEREGYEFVGWKLDYEEEADDDMISYTIQYIDRNTGGYIGPEQITKSAPYGTHIIELPAEITNYKSMQPKYEWDLTEPVTKIFIYYYHDPRSDYGI